jgi:hypothetical protein
MTISSEARKWLLLNTKPTSGVEKLSELKGATIHIEDLMSRLHSFPFPECGTTTMYELFQFILKPALASNNKDGNVLAHVFCVDNQAKTPKEKKAEQLRRDENRFDDNGGENTEGMADVRPYPLDLRIRYDLDNPLVAIGVFSPSDRDACTTGINVRRLIVSRHFRGRILTALHRWMLSLGPAAIDQYTRVVFDDGTSSVHYVHLDEQNFGASDHSKMRAAIESVKRRYWGEADIGVAYWAEALATRGYNVVIHMKDGDIIPIMGMLFLDHHSNEFQQRVYWSRPYNGDKPPKYMGKLRLPAFINLRTAFTDMTRSTGLLLTHYCLLCMLDGTDFFTKKKMINGIGFSKLAQFFIVNKQMMGHRLFRSDLAPPRHRFTELLKFIYFMYTVTCTKAKDVKLDVSHTAPLDAIATLVSNFCIKTGPSAVQVPDEPTRRQAFIELHFNTDYWDLASKLDKSPSLHVETSTMNSSDD